MRRTLKPAAIASIKAKRSAGSSLADLAMEFKRSEAQISRIANNISPVKQKPLIYLTKEENDLALQMSLRQLYLLGTSKVPQTTVQRALTGQDRAGRVRALKTLRSTRAARRLIDRCIGGQAATLPNGCKPWQGAVSTRKSGKSRPIVTSPANRMLDPRKILLAMRGRLGETPRERIRYVGCSGLDGFCCNILHMRLKHEKD